MSGTKAGGKKAATANKAKDPEFYSKIGAKGGKVKGKKGFAITGLAIEAGRKGGLVKATGYRRNS